MRRNLAVLLGLGVCLGVFHAAWGEGADQGPKITLSVVNKTVPEVAAELSKASGLQVGVVDKSQAVVSIELKDSDLEPAIAEVVKTFEGTWMRAYVLEKDPPAGTYSADQLATNMQAWRDDWFGRLSDEDRQALFTKWRTAFQGGMADQPGGGSARRGFGPRGQGGQPGQAGGPAAAGAGAEAGAPPAGMPAGTGADGAAPGTAGAPGAGAGQAGAPGQPGGQRRGRLNDPLRGLMFPLRTETVTLQLDKASLKDALQKLMSESGFIVWPEKELAGEVTLDVKDAPLKEVLDQIAKAVGGKWRTVYLIAEPRELTEAEREERMTQAEDRMWNNFWQRTPEERAQEVQRRTQQIQQWGQAAMQDPNGRAARALGRIGPRILQSMGRRAANLTPEQRMELKPIMQALGAALKGIGK